MGAPAEKTLTSHAALCMSGTVVMNAKAKTQRDLSKSGLVSLRHILHLDVQNAVNVAALIRHKEKRTRRALYKSGYA